MKEILAILEALSTEGGVLATLVTVQGSSYRRPGARMLITAGGVRVGSISGGCLEEDVLARAKAVERTGRPELILYDTTSENDLVWGVGLGCHGVVQVLLEKVEANPEWAMTLAANLAARQPTELATVWRAGDPSLLGTRAAGELRVMAESGVFRQDVVPPISLVVFGAGDDARPLVRFGHELGWDVTVADSRPAFATAERFPQAARTVSGQVEDLVEKVGLESGAVAIVMTHRYAHDVPLLRALLPRPLAYLGLLGPKKRAERIVAELKRDGLPISAEQLARLHAPVGLDLGAELPEEVALAIVAEVQATLSSRDARPLRDRVGPIHQTPSLSPAAVAEPASSVRPEFRFGAVILAAGASARLGQPKQLIEIAGKPMVARAVAAALEARADPVIVVLGANAESVRSACATERLNGAGGSGRSPSHLLFVENPDWAEGMASSIRAGIGALRTAAPDLEAALLAVCDQPAFGAGAILRLIEALAMPGKYLAAARYAGRKGTPAVFRREYFDLLAKLTGDRGAQALFALDPDKVVSVEMPELALDLDAPADLERLNQSHAELTFRK